MFTKDYLNLRLVQLKPSEQWLSEPHRITFLFPKGGSARHSAGSMTQILSPGDVLIVNSALAGKVCPENRSEAMLWSFSVCVENLFPLFASSEICLLQGVLDELKKTRFYPASSQLALECHRLLSEVHPPYEYDLGHRSHLLRIASVMLTVEFKNLQRRHNGLAGVEQHVMEVFQNLSSDEILTLCAEELAAKFGCSRRHLNRLFHQYFGSSLATLKMEMRLLKALSLLRNPDAKIIHVAEDCGFNHLGLFNTCFKRRFGVSPRQWRQTNLHSEGSAPGFDETRLDLRLALQRSAPVNLEKFAPGREQVQSETGKGTDRGFETDSRAVKSVRNGGVLHRKVIPEKIVSRSNHLVAA